MVQVKGNGNMVSKSYPVSSFLRLHIAVKGITELIQSKDERVEIEMDENLVEHFGAFNSGRTLYVSTDSKIRTPNFTKAVVRIYFRQLELLVIRCEGGDVFTPQLITLPTPLDIKVQSVGNTRLNLNSPQVKLMLQTTGDVHLMGDCGVVNINNQSVGNLLAKELFCSELTLKNQAVGNVEVFADKKITISHSGQGYIHYYGDAQLMDVKQYGQGEVRRG